MKLGALLLAWESRTRKTKAESKTDVIPNRAERPVRACPELAEGNLLSHHPSQPHSSEKKIQD
jgi:hypothetical protein